MLTDFGFKLFDAAAVARFTPTELREYEDSLKAYRDIKNSLDTAKEQDERKAWRKDLQKVEKKDLRRDERKDLRRVVLKE